MAVPRPVLLALLGFALIVSALLATRGGGSSERVTAPPAPITKSQPGHGPAPVATPKAHKAAPAKKHAGKKHAPAPHTPAAKQAAKPAGQPAITKLPSGLSPRIMDVVKAPG